ncbi:MAG: flagellar basal-body MS-ring/collar protein FliF [Mariprofundaceae bacterium]|nr:flagellar basal-body MS-ring/collar protein FliF [Mariprofundaceae bacterium]
MADLPSTQQMATPQNSAVQAMGAPLQGEIGAGTAPVASQFINLQNSLISNRRILLFVAGTLMLVGFLSLMLWSSATPYRPIYSGMNEKDAAAIVEMLQKEHVPYKLEGGGTVLVPADKVYAMRLKLASQDMMPGSGTGFEIFDRSNEFGISDFTQKINLQRAQQGELARTIEVLPQVTAARVHLVMPKESAFADHDRKASASVMLQLMGSQRMPKKTVVAIQSLVAASIPELDKSAVVIVDSSGNLLSSKGDEQAAGQGESMKSYQSKMEQRMESRLTTMLDQVVGAGQAVVRVSAKINRQYVEQNSKKYNPDEQVLRSQSSTEENRTSVESSASGVPGVASNTPGSPQILPDGSVAKAGAGNNPPGDRANRRDETNNYEISSTTEHRIIPFGSIDRLSVAVIVGGSFKVASDGAKTFVPRGKSELKSLKNLVRGAMGYNEDRGDTIELQSMPLLDISSLPDAEALQSTENKAFYLEIARYGLVGVALFLLAWFLLRPLAQRITATEESSEKGAGNAALVYQPELSDDARARLEKLEHARQAISNNPERAGKVLNEWVGTA